VSDLYEFSVRIRTLGKRVETNANLLKRKVAIRVDNTVVFATPVDTGRARSNWIVQLGSPATNTVETLGSNAASESIAKARVGIESAQSGDVIHITNNLAYISKLNDGWSAQAPANFVAEAVSDGVASIKGVEVTTGRGL
jgi:hypothetical protein